MTYELYSIDFIDTSTGWVCGEFGTILKTTDGGDSWVEVSSGVESDINGIFFRTSSIGYAAGANGVLLKSSDGGSTWEESSSNATEDFLDIGVLGNGVSNTVVAVGISGNIYRSTNDGSGYS